jgi:hypothetical protein
MVNLDRKTKKPIQGRPAFLASQFPATREDLERIGNLDRPQRRNLDGGPIRY